MVRFQRRGPGDVPHLKSGAGPQGRRCLPWHPQGLRLVGCHDCIVSSWFRTYGFADVHDRLIVGALPLDEADVRMLAALGVTRVLNLVEDAEYGQGERHKVER